jgi:RimJ/RimL family protein N-acetyltransferase
MAKRPAATEAQYLLAQHAIEHMGYRRYEWKCDSQNKPSIAAALRFGFEYEGCFRQHRVTALKTNRDTSWFSMLDSEWPQRQRDFKAWLDASNFDDNGKQRKSLVDIRTELSAS